MTLKELKGRWFREIQDLTPDAVIPDQDDLIRESIRAIIKPCGGIERVATFTMVPGTREYGTTAGFPADFLRIGRVWDNATGIPLEPISKGEREELGTGTPSRYYKFAAALGVDPVPIIAGTIKMDYFGSGDDVTDQDAEILPDFAIMKDDDFWNAPVFYAATTYFRIKQDYDRMALYDSMMKKARWEARKMIVSHNQDVNRNLPPLPTDYMGPGSALTFRERASQDGDLVREF
jgi:hypothetical protein